MFVDEAHAKAQPNELHQQVFGHIEQVYGWPSAEPCKGSADVACKIQDGRLPPKDKVLVFQ